MSSVLLDGAAKGCNKCCCCLFHCPIISVLFPPDPPDSQRMRVGTYQADNLYPRKEHSPAPPCSNRIGDSHLYPSVSAVDPFLGNTQGIPSGKDGLTQLPM